MNSQVGSQVDPQLRNWILNLRNGTLMPRRCFAACENFRKLNSGLVKLSFEDFASWPPFSQVGPRFHKLEVCYVFQAFSPSLVLYGFPPIPLNPPDFDHSKSLSYIKIK